ncbi:hypothetical protein P153DRAFT_51198 [Dothidotthia symphoricarpi CBS 119687]|uniref:Uncharacterized protein n=1 Tax=Dothidotthia symphoricarpi CBS 119687 TaxID=1392245 RepID=A0A6A6A8M0_9PLEO|nr:uncharacterized protein P153DRAFT_51198 [Dothidotthia symphoricarpi CBS 119687]KAF2127523.1 hypothetical protein P153DRAFT_51198 [Dothidotthia symphoricarpi CBS 119687]
MLLRLSTFQSRASAGGSAHGVVLDYGSRCLSVGGQAGPTLPTRLRGSSFKTRGGMHPTNHRTTLTSLGHKLCSFQVRPHHSRRRSQKRACGYGTQHATVCHWNCLVCNCATGSRGGTRRRQGPSLWRCNPLSLFTEMGGPHTLLTSRPCF